MNQEQCQQSCTRSLAASDVLQAEDCYQMYQEHTAAVSGIACTKSEFIVDSLPLFCILHNCGLFGLYHHLLSSKVNGGYTV